MPHAALWVVQLWDAYLFSSGVLVSMPHAALWVVQHPCKQSFMLLSRCFNAARGFVGGATNSIDIEKVQDLGFNAARGFVGGATEALITSGFRRKSFNAARGFVGGAAFY